MDRTTSILLTTCSRCGSHWLRHILQEIGGWRYLVHVHNERSNIPARALQIEEASPGGRIWVVHTPIEALLHLSSLQVIALARDPRDVAVSAANYYARSVNWLGDPDVARWLMTAFGTHGPSFEAVLDHMKVHGHNMGWFESYVGFRSTISHTLMRYEDLVYNPGECLEKTLGIPVEESAAAIERWSFKRLSGGREPGQERPSHHYRKGVVGEWKDHFTEEENLAFIEKYREGMELFGYS